MSRLAQNSANLRLPGEVFRRSVRVLGLRYTCRLYASGLLRPDSHAYDESFDSRWNADTAGAWDYKRGALPPHIDGTAEGYEGARIDVVRHAFRLLPMDPSTTELWDLGSGKGRVLILGAEAGFKRVVGVELNDELHDIAKINVEQANHALPASSIELINASATEVDLPDEPVVVFMFNPFRGAVFGAVVEKLEQRVGHGDAPLWVIYINPRERDLLDRSQHFELVADERVNPFWWSVNIYRSA